MTDALPAGAIFVSAAAPAGWTRNDSVAVGGTGSIVFTKASAASEETATFTITVKVPSSAANGATLSDSAVAGTNDANTVDAVPGNNTAAASTGVITRADLEVTTLSASPNPVSSGSTVTYTVDITNNGPSDAAGVTVSDPLPAGTTLASEQILTGSGWSRTDSVAVGANGAIVFSDADLIAGATASFQIVANTSASTIAGSNVLNDAATIVTTTTDPTPGNDLKTVTTSVSPVINQSTASLSAQSTSLTINGAGFDPILANDVITFSGGVTGTVTAATGNQLTIGNLSGLVAGAMNATVTVRGASSGAPVQVATVTPVVTANTAPIGPHTTTLVINGFGFASSNAANSVVFSPAASGSVTTSSPTQLTFTFTSPPASGPVTAIVTSNSVSSGNAVEVATFDGTPPTVASGQFNLDAPLFGTVSFAMSESISSAILLSHLRVDAVGGPAASYVPSSVVQDPVSHVATFTFPALFPDQNYRTTLSAAGLTDAAGNPLAADFTFDFYMLTGDTNRDRTVNFTDLLTLAQHYGTSGATYANGDLNGDGSVNFTDLLALAQDYGTTLAAPAQAAAAAPAQVVPAFSLSDSPDSAGSQSDVLGRRSVKASQGKLGTARA